MTRAAVLLGMALALQGAAIAEERSARLGHGESYADLARRHYGDPSLGYALRMYNDDAPEQAGVTVRLPVARARELGPGDSWSGVAGEVWSRPDLGRALAELVSGSPDAAVEPGKRVILPVRVPYRLRAGESLATVSRHFFGHPERALLLAALNGIQDPLRLAVGARIHVPVPGLVLRGPPADPPAVSAPPPPAPPEPPPPAAEPAPEQPKAPAPHPDRSAEERKLDAALRRASNALLEGHYESGLESLETLRPQVLAEGSPAQMTRLLRELVVAYAAWDRSDAACESYRAWRQIDREPRLDPERTSPKILRIIRSCH